MAYIGNSLTQQSFTGGMDQFNGNASNTTFGLSRNITTPFDINVYVEGVFQRPGVSYTVSANTITFESAPSSGANNIVVVYENFTATSVVPIPGSVTPTSIAANTIQATLGYVPANKAGDTFTGLVQSNTGFRTTVANTSISSFNGRTFINTNATGDSEIGGGSGSNYTDLMVNGSAFARMSGSTLTLNGGQIKFPVTQVASSDANTLDDYEEGTWTPTLTGGGSNPTVSYNAQHGSYTKVGRSVSIQMYIETTARSGGSGAVQITLPFVVSSHLSTYGGVAASQHSGLGLTTAGVRPVPGSSVLQIQSNTTGTTLDISSWTAGGYVLVGLTYSTN